MATGSRHYQRMLVPFDPRGANGNKLGYDRSVKEVFECKDETCVI